MADMKHLVSLGCPDDAQVGVRGIVSQTSSSHLLKGTRIFLPVLSSSLLPPLQVTPGTNPSLNLELVMAVSVSNSMNEIKRDLQEAGSKSMNPW